MIYVGIDNGVSGSIGIVDGDRQILVSSMYYKMPVFKSLSYTRHTQWISRIDIVRLKNLLCIYSGRELRVILERPLVNPMMFKATQSAMRALEATLIVLEELKFSYMYCDSKEWQKVLLPSGLKGGELKKASLDIGMRLFPSIDFNGFADADGLLIAEYSRRVSK